MYTLVIQTEEEFQKLTDRQKEAVVLILSREAIKHLVEGLSRICLHNKRRRQNIEGKEVILADRKGTCCMR